MLSSGSSPHSNRQKYTQKQQRPRGSVQSSNVNSETLDQHRQGLALTRPKEEEKEEKVAKEEVKVEEAAVEKSEKEEEKEQETTESLHEPSSSPSLSTSSRDSLNDDTSSTPSSNRSSVITTPDSPCVPNDRCPSQTRVASSLEIPTISITPVRERRTSFSQFVDERNLAYSAESPVEERSFGAATFLRPLSLSGASPAENTATGIESDSVATPSWWKLGLGTKDMTLTGDSRPRASPDARRGKIGTCETASRRTSASSTFSFIASSMSALSRFTQNASTYAPDDELCNMNIETVFGDAEPPSMIKDHATTLLARFQTAYRTQSAVLREVQSECSAGRDELAGMTARARHLQTRLEDAARRAAEQEEALAAILEELNAEKKARIECERAAREKGLVLVRRDLNEDPIAAGEEEGGSILTEDLGADDDQRRRKWIQQAGEAKNGDAGFETDEESYESASIFSRSRSPTMPVPPGSSAASPDASPSRPGLLLPYHPRSRLKTTCLSPGHGSQTQRLSALQKIFKGISGEGEEGSARASLASCSNCRGGDASVAWDTVSLLRDENKGLKQRVAGLESAVEGRWMSSTVWVYRLISTANI
ncbi:unnamed protein product [Parascedosporium putredinis]|uniref:Uncharacterized protein n=1 Tax=Parascedosporium putredinis TaxID=1442378 RepID=A0A9P1M8C4_9PEZI|nr:unnamed protein product [Parascedosporium putredinis]CAI7988647.1 unnamed protein product [Parascedosporium putredinis]